MTAPTSGGGDDLELLAVLRRMWEEVDPPADDLADRMVLAVAVEGLDADLMDLTADLREPAGARSEDPARTVTFSHDDVSVMVTITPRRDRRFRLDGWVAPASGGRLQLRRPDGGVRESSVDVDGRFVLPDVTEGLVQLVYQPGPDGPLVRPVAAPPVRL